MGPPPPGGGAISSAKSGKIWRIKNLIAAKPRSELWSKFRKENHQKLTFRAGVQPWDLSRFSWRIESYRFIMESSIFKPYSASF